MMPIFEGKLPLFVHAGTLAQMEAALAWAREAQLKIVLVGGNDAWRDRAATERKRHSS